MRQSRAAAGLVWRRGRLVAVLSAAVTVALLALAGVGLAFYYTVHPTGGPAHTADPGRPTFSGPGASVSDEHQRRDRVASEPMPTIGLDQSRPGRLSTRDPGHIVLPRTVRLGAADVATGVPQTPEGALAQLAAIDQAALQSGSLPGVREVIVAWAAPGGPTPQSWSGTRAMSEFLTAAGLSAAGDPDLAVVATPLMGLIRGRVGDGYVVACVLFEVDATLTTTSRVAAADCQRMVWQHGRWVIGPGAEPAPAPSPWPGTDAAIDVGYRELRYG